MRLPRRVPWASLSDLDEVCVWIYADENDLDAKQLVVNRLSAWKSITPLPHALEATLSILTAMLQDASSQSSTTFLSLRQSYATAIIRLVNGLVDSLQVGAYARSIASIAAQLGLPAWFVELRHSATHEDLPSLEVLRTASREAMRWLLNNYFLPTLNPSSQPTAPQPTLRSLSPLLQKYKTLMKTVTRDASLRNRLKDEITRIFRDIERWMSEAKVAANVSLSSFEWDVGGGEQDAEQGDFREKWVIDVFCDHLLEKGILVPSSKKKRLPSSNDSFEPSAVNLLIWQPLLTHVHSQHRNLPSALIFKIIAHLASKPTALNGRSEADIILLSQEERDATYDLCVATWANWLVGTYASSAAHRLDEEGDQTGLSREDAVIALLNILRPDRNGEGGNEKIARKLLGVLCSNHSSLDRIASLVPTLSQKIPSGGRPPSASSAPQADLAADVQEWHDEDLASMSNRLDAVLSRPFSPLSAETLESMEIDSESTDIRAPMGTTSATELPRGWRKLTAQDGWRPAPIGVFVSVR